MNEFFQKIKVGFSDFLPSNIIDSVPGDETGEQSRLFRSARVKLTLFYMAVLIVFCLVVSLTIRGLASHRFDQAGQGERGAVRELIYNYYSVPLQPGFFNNFESQQSANVHRDLDEYVFIVNVIAIAIGGVASYWYAGRTLRPIEEAHEAQARFVTDASHELRTPLTNMKAENEVFLRQKSFTNSEAKDLIVSNLEEVERLENLATNLLALSQYENSSLELSKVDIKEIINQAADLTTKTAENKKIKLSKKIAEASVIGNQNSLVELLGILLDNAVKYSPKASKININGSKSGKYYHIYVRDQGPGISQSDMPYIFDRLFRGEKSRTSKVPGYGLGLALAKEIAEANHAQLIARNVSGGGAEFNVSLKLS